MVQCVHGLRDVSYELGDSSKWEFIFPHIAGPTVTTKITKACPNAIHHPSHHTPITSRNTLHHTATLVMEHRLRRIPPMTLIFRCSTPVHPGWCPSPSAHRHVPPHPIPHHTTPHHITPHHPTACLTAAAIRDAVSAGQAHGAGQVCAHRRLQRVPARGRHGQTVRSVLLLCTSEMILVMMVV